MVRPGWDLDAVGVCHRYRIRRSRASRRSTTGGEAEAAPPAYYLISPPDRPGSSEPDPRAPMSKRPRLSSYGSSAECFAALDGLRVAARSKLQGASLGPERGYLLAVKAYIQASDSKCVLSNDPRLR